MPSYPGKTPKKPMPKLPASVLLDKIEVNNAKKCFAALPNAGQFNQTKYDLKTFPSYRLTSSTRNGNKLKNHFQGIVRLKDGQHFVASVGDKTFDKAVLVVFKHDSHVLQAKIESKGPVGSNTKFQNSNNDEIVEFIHINPREKNLWHPGGLGLQGDIIAVPLENFTNNTTRVDFYNFEDPFNPVKLPFDISCNERFGAVDLAKLSNGKYICILYSNPKKMFRIYTSVTTDFNDGFNSGSAITQDIPYASVVGLRRHITDVAFQSIQVLQETNGGLYLLVSGNMSNASPTINGSNYCALLNLSVTGGVFGLLYEDHLIVDSEDDYSNFDAGFGLYVQNSDRIGVYSIYHWRAHRYLKWAEYFGRENVQTASSHNKSDAFIELYSEINFDDKSLILYGDDIQDIVNYRNIVVQKKHFNDMVKSIRYRLPSGYKYELYEHASYRTQQNDKWLTLTGSGKIKILNDLGKPSTSGLRLQKPFDRKISSSRSVS